MDTSSIITQVQRDDEQLNTFPPSENGTPANNANNNAMKKPRNRGIFSSFFCCFGTTNNNNPPSSCQVPVVEENGNPRAPPEKYLLSQVRHQDMNRKCVVIDLDETLVHSSFKPINNADFIVPVEIEGTVHQVYVLKRPYVDEFLKKMGEMFECVLFTASLAKYADPVADLLDKWGVFRARLFRESCVFHRGNYVKDLSRLGRDLDQVVIIDNSPASYIFHPDNAVPVQSWFDDMSDTELMDLIPFLKVSQRWIVYIHCFRMPIQLTQILHSSGFTDLKVNVVCDDLNQTFKVLFDGDDQAFDLFIFNICKVDLIKTLW